MIKWTFDIRREFRTMLWSMIPYTIILNWIVFGSRFFTEARVGILGELIAFPVIGATYLFFSQIAGIFRLRLPDDSQFFKRVMLQILLYLLLSALIILGLITLYRLVGILHGPYDSQFTWAFIFTGIINIFLTFFNEALYRFEVWKADLRETEQLKLTYKQGQLMGLKSQINPHVLFNSLNSLSGLIQEDSQKAERFLDEMSKVYRYMLRHEEESLVPLQTELQFIDSYFALLKARYNEGIDLKLEINEEDQQKLIPPLSLQVILENAIFQNKIARQHPLRIKIQSVRGNALVVTNNMQRKMITETVDYEAGLDNLVKKYQLLNQPPVDIREEASERRIRLPLIESQEVLS
ncbi:MAG: sensor histidine kinase [Chitinophagaceae bacterium]